MTRRRNPRAFRTDPWLKGPVAIFLAALAIRLLHVWQMRDTLYLSVLMGDSRGYDQWALQIAGGEWLGREVFYQAPLYPYFLGLVYAIFGRDLLMVRIIQAVLGAASCGALAFAASQLISRNAGIVAGLMLAFYPPAIFFDGLVQKSVLDALFICIALALISRNVAAGDDSRAWLLLGITMGALSLTRENAIALVACIVVWALLRQKRSRTRRAPAILFITGFALIVMPVAVRNYAVGGGVYLTTSQFGSNLFIGNNERADGSYTSLRPGRGSPEYERLDATALAEEALGRPLTPSEVSGYWTERTLAFIGSDPAAWLKLMARKLRLLLSASEIIDTESLESHAEYSWPLRLIAVWNFGVLLTLAVVGLAIPWPERTRLGIVFAMASVYALSVIAFFVVSRYRHPLVPFIMIVAAAGATGLRSFIRTAPRPNLLGTAAAAAAIAVCAFWPLHTVEARRAITENNLGTALQESGRVDEAINRYERALAFDARYSPALNNLGTALRMAGRVDEAVAVYSRALEQNRDWPSVHLNLGNALVTQGLLPEAIASFRRARSIEDSPHTRDALASALYDYGTAALESGAIADALTAFRESLDLKPDSAEAHNNLGIALASQGRIDDAVRHWQEAVRLKPGFADAQQNLERATERR